MRFLLWSMEEQPLPEKEVSCPCSVVGILIGSFCWVCVFFNVYLMQVIVFKVSYVSLLSSPV